MANKTITSGALLNTTMQKDGLRTQRESLNNKIHHNQHSQSMHQNVLFKANPLKIQSKSPPQQSTNQLPAIVQPNKLGGSFLGKKKSHDNMTMIKDFEQEQQKPRKGSYQQDQTVLNESAFTHTYAPASTFNPNNVKLKLKSGVSTSIEKEVIIEKSWLRRYIPHIAKVINDVNEDEGVEITINCNVYSFNWILTYLQNEDEEDNVQLFMQINDDNCLNLLVSACFLGLFELYDKVWRLYFSDNIANIINKCELNLKGVNKKILEDIAEKIEDHQIELILERIDKFISQIYKSKCEYLITFNEIQACTECHQILTKSNMKKINCTDSMDHYIAADGRLVMRHSIDQAFDKVQFMGQFRLKYRICWREIYEKLKAIIDEAQYCLTCDEWFTINQMGQCKFHKSKPVSSSIANEQVQVQQSQTFRFICCMKEETAFSGCEYKPKSSCQYEFHQPRFENEAQRIRFESSLPKWYLIRDQIPSEDIEQMNAKLKDKVTFIKPQSQNFNTSLSQAYTQLKQPQPYFTKPDQFVNDDILFNLPQAQQHCQELIQDSSLRDHIALTAKQIVRSRSPNQTSSTDVSQHLPPQHHSFRLTLDVDTNQVSLKKRSLSPQQIKEVQVITRKKIWECKHDIIREDDQRSMRIMTQLLRQQRQSDECQQVQQKASKKGDESFYIDISQISQNTKIIKQCNKTNRSTERRRKSPSLVIKQNQIMRKASPN